MHVIDQYAQDVAGGRIVAGKYHRLACERHIRDRARAAANDPEFPYRFVPALADRFYRFAGTLRHYKGEWAGRPIVLEPFQLFQLGSVFAWVHVDTGLRRFRVAYNELPRKNGKSLIAAIVALYVTFFDGEAGAEGYCIATKREQARIVFNDCKKLVAANRALRARITAFTANLHREATASKLEPLGADRDSTDGLNPHIVTIDEAHAMKTRGLIDVMETAVGARQQPLINWITTAGADPMSPCGDQHDYVCKVLEQARADDSVFGFIAHADEHDDPWHVDTWRKANPNFGVSVKRDDLENLARKAQYMPAAANAFRQKRLNIWVTAFAPWLSMEGWQRGQSDWALEDMAGEVCWLGVDLSSKIDLTAIALVFPPNDERRSWRVAARCLTPEATLDDRAHRDRAPYRQWLEAGYLHACAGNRIDQDAVRLMVQDACDRFDVQQIGIDPYNAGNLVNLLEQEDGLAVVEIPQSMLQMSGPAKEFEADVLDGLIDAAHNPLLAWCVSNVVVQRDGKDNIYPVKKRSRGRIDPVVALLLARKLAALDSDMPDAEDPALVVA